MLLANIYRIRKYVRLYHYQGSFKVLEIIEYSLNSINYLLNYLNRIRFRYEGGGGILMPQYNARKFQVTRNNFNRRGASSIVRNCMLLKTKLFLLPGVGILFDNVLWVNFLRIE